MRAPLIRHLAALAVSLFALICAPFALGEEALPPLEAYYIDPCGACQGSANPGCGECSIENGIYLHYRALLDGLGQKGRRILLFNLRRLPDQYETLEKRLRNQGVEAFDLPLVMAGEAAFPADGSADAALRGYLTGGALPQGISLLKEQVEKTIAKGERAERNLIYIYSEYCEDCRDISPWIEENLPEGVRLLKYDIASREGLEMEAAVEARYRISPDEFMVPALFSGDWALLGSAQIHDRFFQALQQADRTPVDELLAK